MTDLTRLLQDVEGDGVHWTLDSSGDLNVNLVHLDAGHVVGEHTNDEVDVVIVVLAGRGQLMIDGGGTDLTRHVVANVPRASRRSLHAADGGGLDYLTIHRRRGPLGIGGERSDRAVTEPRREEGGDPACWAHLFENDDTEAEG
jgi:mannose-6-phosphate isomerase-like protein (cupin superfamily)